MTLDLLNVVGTSARRVDAVEKVTGRAQYITDLRLPGMAYAKLCRSPLPHARIGRTAKDAALACPGVLAVVTAADLTGCEPLYGPAYRDTPILPADRVRYAGEPVAAVVAETEAQAQAAVGLLDVELHELPAATTLDAALAPGAPILHEALRTSGHFRDLMTLKPVPERNICQHYHYERGDVARAFAESDLVVEDTFTLPAIFHYAMEPHTAVARVTPEGITVWASTQHPFPVRKELAELFRAPLSHVQVIVPPIGGAYGGKCYTKLEPIAVALARIVRRPVRVANTLEESAKTITRHAARVRVKTGVRRDGTLLARACDVLVDTGAYADIGPRVANKSGFRAPGPYRIPHLVVDSRAVFTNNVPAGAYRGYGTPQVTWAAECQMDAIAERLGMDPLELRLRNLLVRGEQYVAGETPMDGDLLEGLRRTAQAIAWTSSPECRVPSPESLLTPNASRLTSGRLRRGKGLACAFKDGGGTHSVSTAIVRIHADGSVTVLVGSVEHGQGVRTVMAQVVAETLGVPLDRVIVATPDTALAPFDQGTSASRSTTLMGLAVQSAAREAREQLLKVAGPVLGADPARLEVRDGAVMLDGKAMPLAEVFGRHFGLPGGEIIGSGAYRSAQWAGTLIGSTTFWEVGMGGAEVAVDEETGEVHLLGYISMADVGRAINPRECEAQDEGAAMQGIGPALFESLVNQDGQLVNASPVDYRVPTFEDPPDQFGTILLENGDGPGPYG
ncbi:MAG TPA: xanthine dehydrogenase family protein molybdopterin-binding subunit, partial [Candidatus Methylomirabilis sp.]